MPEKCPLFLFGFKHLSVQHTALAAVQTERIHHAHTRAHRRRQRRRFFFPSP